MPLSVILVVSINSADAIRILEQYGVQPLEGRINERYALIRTIDDEIFVLMNPLRRFSDVAHFFRDNDILLEEIMLPPDRPPRKRRLVDFNDFRPNKRSRE